MKLLLPMMFLVIILVSLTFSAGSISSNFGISYEKININTYNVTFWDNSSVQASVNVITNNNVSGISSFTINKTIQKTFTITSNLTLEMLYNDTIVAHATLVYTSISSFFSLSVLTLANDTYMVQYHVLPPAVLIIKSVNGTVLYNYQLNSQYGAIYVSPIINPESAVLLYNNTAEVIHPFPYIQPTTHTVIVYQGLSTQNAYLIVIGSFFGAFLVSFSVIVGMKRMKYRLGTNKSELLYERLEDNPLANVEIRDASMLKYLTKLVKDVEDERKNNQDLLQKITALKAEIEKLRGKQ